MPPGAGVDGGVQGLQQSDVATVDAGLLREIVANPGGFYANIHTSDFPGGAVRARQAITRGILRMCEELAITVIAEGVETAGERDFFLHEGVRLMQGYLFARPRFEALAPRAEIFG